MQMAPPRLVGDVAILDLEGTLLLSSDDEPRDSVRALADEGRLKVLLNLALLSHCDSAGVGVFVGTYISLRRKGGTLKFLRPRGQVRHLLEATRLTRVFEIFEDENEAVESFARLPAASGARVAPSSEPSGYGRRWT